jgi:putative transposase
MLKTSPTKTSLAKKLQVSRRSLYYTPTKDIKDEQDAQIVKQVIKTHPAYGHKRVALELHWGKNKVRRLMKKFNLKPYRRRVQKPPVKSADYGLADPKIINIYTQCPMLNDIDELGVIWRGDFTYIKYRGKFYYLATVIEVASRDVIGFAFSDYHDSELVVKAMQMALDNFSPPTFFHSDQGSEYRSQVFQRLLEKYQIIQSMSDKSSPWHNAHQESFFSHFKLEFGDFNRFESLGETIANIYDMIGYYNSRRIHIALKMPPAAYRNRLLTISKKRQVV